MGNEPTHKHTHLVKENNQTNGVKEGILANWNEFANKMLAKK